MVKKRLGYLVFFLLTISFLSSACSLTQKRKTTGLLPGLSSQPVISETSGLAGTSQAGTSQELPLETKSTPTPSPTKTKASPTSEPAVTTTTKETGPAKESEPKTQPEESKKEKEPQETAATIDYSQFKPGQLVRVKTPFPVYTTATDAARQAPAQATYPAGEYYVYKSSHQAVNLSRAENSPGGWTALGRLGVDNFTVGQAPAKEDPEPQNDAYLNASDKEYSWSWGYPDSSGRDILEKTNGFYKKYETGKVLYLTFDNGYEYNNLTAEILRILADNQVKATFFVTGSYMVNNPGLVLQMVKEGHSIGNHSQKPCPDTCRRSQGGYFSLGEKLS